MRVVVAGRLVNRNPTHPSLSYTDRRPLPCAMGMPIRQDLAKKKTYPALYALFSKG